ncbi:MAG: hypothetical protein ACK55I_01325, partial [bacterium]
MNTFIASDIAAGIASGITPGLSAGFAGAWRVAPGLWLPPEGWGTFTVRRAGRLGGLRYGAE